MNKKVALLAELTSSKKETENQLVKLTKSTEKQLALMGRTIYALSEDIDREKTNDFLLSGKAIINFDVTPKIDITKLNTVIKVHTRCFCAVLVKCYYKSCGKERHTKPKKYVYDDEDIEELLSKTSYSPSPETFADFYEETMRVEIDRTDDDEEETVFTFCGPLYMHTIDVERFHELDPRIEDNMVEIGTATLGKPDLSQ